MLIHKMRLDNDMAVLDVNSGAVHLVDEVMYRTVPAVLHREFHKVKA